MSVVCCGKDRRIVEFLCCNPFCLILEKRTDCNGTYYYQLNISFENYLKWLNEKCSGQLVVNTSPEIWINRKKVSLSIRYNSCFLYFHEIHYLDIKDIIKSNFVI